MWEAFGAAPFTVSSVRIAGGIDLLQPLPHDPGVSTHHSETAMPRYLRRLADRDYALDRGMIPLGVGTMKLNATAPRWSR